MAFDNSKPANNTKIRNGPGQIRDNFIAIEDADSSFIPSAVNLEDRTASVAGNPTAVTDSIIIFGKQDSSNVQQVYSIDDSSNIQQLTGNGYTETTNAGTAGGTLNKTEVIIGEGVKLVIYSGKTAGFSGSRTVIFPTNYSSIYSATVTADDVNIQKTSVVKSVSGLTVYTENLVSVNWMAIGRIS